MRPIDFLEQVGLLGPRTHCVHMTALGDQDIANVAKHGAHVVHCPRSNLKLGSGNLPVQKLLDQDINVALGTDGAASNNRLSMLGELQTASLLGKKNMATQKAVDAWTALELATVNGAIALGQQDKLGTIEVGKTADLIAWTCQAYIIGRVMISPLAWCMPLMAMKSRGVGLRESQ